MADTYTSARIEDLNPDTPSNAESIGTAAIAIRQNPALNAAKLETCGNSFSKTVFSSSSEKVVRKQYSAYG